ncbi:hypothetical protein C2K69_17775 [Salmonella enterica]|nr:hypothetical protein [Salmonella enterica]ECS5961081.1 hypothetical protein [Salmonella enterica subsp. enterica serovar Enteritidis]ELO61334.1 hypothetical protein SEEE4220_23370 [Salmonella enterica subsp. enterica serovar Enteritidis str. 543463 42-20]KSB82266.1 hypothetical protein LFZ30_04435 [Salmonella enterica subsp. enterica serovar Moscow str. SA20061414]PUL20004.1 hypothetical protein B1M69_05895 [Salmonella enterica subsp. enterica serovar Dublin]
MIDVIDQLVLLIAKRLGIKTGHVKLCIVLQGFAFFFQGEVLERVEVLGGGGALKILYNFSNIK